ncbi:MAG: (p)ppGpp synthetase [Candidatus Marinimicrobia bacterium]|nr:(p)ppGpp synthetase [Candidatus Neomarinimicrobiota bacterium]
MKKELITEFKGKEGLFNSFRESVVNLIEDLLLTSNVNPHQIDSRTKSFESLLNKIITKDKYNALNEITDIVGIRVITYLESEVNTVNALIRKEFDIDEGNSIDKRLLQSNKFGYRSLHLVASLDESRLNLTEYRRYKGLKFEIQIRSILQHAWAEIEHDLGYKGRSSIPDSSVRSFNRMAALLESADIEFDRLKTELTKYENEVPALIKKSPESVTINQASLNSLVKTNKTFEIVREYVRTDCEVKFDSPNSYSDLIDKLELFKIKNIKELQQLIENNSDVFIAFVKTFVKKGITKNLADNILLYWFQHFLAAKTEEAEFIDKYLHHKGRNISSTPEEFIDRYKKVKITANNVYKK